jgi:hypothetical protein
VDGRPFSLRTHLALVILGAVLPSALLAGVIVQRSLEDTRIHIEHRLLDAARADAEALDRGSTERSGCCRRWRNRRSSTRAICRNFGPRQTEPCESSRAGSR